MGRSKVSYFGDVLIDLTNDSVTEDTLAEGVTAHKANGDLITGKLKVQKLHVGSNTPDGSIGDDGDLYLIVKE